MSDEQKTRILSGGNRGADATRIEAGAPVDDGATRVQGAAGFENAATRIEGSAASPGQQGQTRILGAGGAAAAPAAPRAANAPGDPVVGWLVVVAGPGRGNACEIHNGMNSLGRNAAERIPVNFGDETISREAHAYIVYDDQQKKFYIQHGGKSNLVRINNSPVLAPTEMNRGDTVLIGGTSLLFVPLCGPDFSWDQVPSV